MKIDPIVNDRPDLALIRLVARFRNADEAQAVSRIVQGAECAYRDWILYELKELGVKFTGSATDHLRAVECGMKLRPYWHMPLTEHSIEVNRRVVVHFHTLDEWRTVNYFKHGIESINFTYRDFLMVLVAFRGIEIGNERQAFEYGIGIRSKV